MSIEKFYEWAIKHKMKPMVCGNCLHYGKITRYCHCKTNKRVKKRYRHENSPKCTEFTWSESPKEVAEE